MTTLTRSNAKALAAKNTLDFADLDDMDVVAPPATARLAPRQTPAPLPQAKQEIKTMNTNTGIKYLSLAIQKASDKPHANFLANKTPDALLRIEQIRLCAARGYDAHPNNPRASINFTAQALKGDTGTYIQFLKGIASDCSFLAHMDCVQYQRRSRPESFDAGIDAIMEGHPLDESDVPPFDMGTAAKDTVREEYSGGTAPEPVATSVADAYEAIEGIQGWLSLFTVKMAVKADGVTLDPENNLAQQKFWGVDGLFPLKKRVDTLPNGKLVFTDITSFDDYREMENEKFKAKRTSVPFTADMSELIVNA